MSDLFADAAAERLSGNAPLAMRLQGEPARRQKQVNIRECAIEQPRVAP